MMNKNGAIVIQRVLKESNIVGYHRKLYELSMSEKLNFKNFGFCHSCKQLKTYDYCKKCN